jgi:hypothetical protein
MTVQRYWIGFDRTDSSFELPSFPIFVRAGVPGTASFAAFVEALSPDEAWASILSAFPGARQRFVVARREEQIERDLLSAYRQYERCDPEFLLKFALERRRIAEEVMVTSG